MAEFGLMVRLATILSVVSSLTMPAQAEGSHRELLGNSPPEPAIAPSASHLAQVPPVQIIDVRVKAGESGLQVVLETADGTLLEPTTSVLDDALILEIPGAVLVGDSFEEFAPADGIALVQVNQRSPDTVEVAITGADAAPQVKVNSEAAGLTLDVVPMVAEADDDEDEAIQILVTGEEDEGYNPSNASTATRTDTPLRDLPQSIQVVPRQLIEDRNVRTITEAVETVSGVVEDFRFFNGTGGTRRIRGFSSNSTLRNGFPEGRFSSSGTVPLAIIEQVEVLKGPASAITGTLEPGGVINYITRQPLRDPYYSLSFEAGNRGLYQPSVDLSGPVTADRDVLYRFIAAFEGRDSFQDFANSEITSIAPSISLSLGPQTDLNIYYEYSRYFASPFQSAVPLLSDGSLPSRALYPSYPNLQR
ncbi:MAG: TonB-dependent receptor plug domain-containing protein, partial [Cyanobacteria bacterium P01_F01_bin.153]